MFAFLLVILYVVNLSMCLFACLCLSASVCLRLSVCLYIYLSICLYAVGRSQLSAGQSRCARSVQAAEGEDAESESGIVSSLTRKVVCFRWKVVSNSAQPARVSNPH